MARQESKATAGYLPLLDQHYQPIFSLVARATPHHRILDPTAGQGEFIAAAQTAWNVTAYGNELDKTRAALLIEKLGARALQGDAERLTASNKAFSLVWMNPPYDHDKTSQDSESQRLEYHHLKLAWKWLQDGGIGMWCVYHPHLTNAAIGFFSRNASRADVWALPGKHLGQYDQILVVALKGEAPDPAALERDLRAQRDQPLPLTLQDEPVYRMPAAAQVSRFLFTPNVVDAETGLRYISDRGAWQNETLQSLITAPSTAQPVIRSVMPPRPGHTLVVLADGIANGAIIPSDQYGTVSLRGKTTLVEEVVEETYEPTSDPDHWAKRTRTRIKPKSTLTLLTKDGTIVELNNDETMIDFILNHKKPLTQLINQRFNPMYSFDLNGLRGYLDAIRLNGKYPLFTPQKHVVGAITRGFEERDGILLIGQMGTGKTIIGGSSAIALATGVAKAMRAKLEQNQVILIVCPPHLVDKWKREAQSISPRTYIEQLNRHEDVKTFMETVARLSPQVAKIGIIKREMTKLGSGFRAAVIWRSKPFARWKRHEPPPSGWTADQRIGHRPTPQCPNCGSTIYMKEDDERPQIASKEWLQANPRTCSTCFAALWQEKRDKGSEPLPGQKYPRGNPRYRLDQYIKRRYPGRVALLIWDEVHEAQNSDTGNGSAFGRFANLADKVLAMTGTPFNGKASSLMNLEYALNPRVRQHYPWGGAPRTTRKDRANRNHQTPLEHNSKQRGQAYTRWVEDMGVREGGEDELPQYDGATGAFTGTRTFIRPYVEAAGIAPHLVAEVQDHSVFFALRDISEALPDYSELAVPIPLDDDVAEAHAKTKDKLADYLADCRKDRDGTFRGPYYHWCIDWLNSNFQPYTVIHHKYDLEKRETVPHVVTSLPGFGTERLYNKEAKLLEILGAELDADRPCVVFCRQTDKRDIQPRLAELITKHLPLAKPFILTASVNAEKRERTIEQAVAKGHNVLITHPELVKTGLDLLFAGTLIFFEPVLNLSTMMQASGRHYRLNQTRHKECRVIHLYYEGTMEARALQLMSRKQRAAKILLGEIGLTGLEALTQDDGGLEQALMNSITQDDEFVDPADLFKQRDEAAIVDAEDLGYWNVALADDLALKADPLLEHAQAMGATLTLLPKPDAEAVNALAATLTVADYLNDELMIGNRAQKSTLVAKISNLISQGRSDGMTKLLGINHPDYQRYTFRQSALHKAVVKELRGAVARSDEAKIAQRAIDLALKAAGQTQSGNVFAALSITHTHETALGVLTERATLSGATPAPAAVATASTAAAPPTFRDIAAELITRDPQHLDQLVELFTVYTDGIEDWWTAENAATFTSAARRYLLQHGLCDRDTGATLVRQLIDRFAPKAAADTRTTTSQQKPQLHKAETRRRSALTLDTAPAPRELRRSFRPEPRPEEGSLEQLSLFA